MGGCAPVLFLVFNRPEQTAAVMQAIREARPSRLYVAADGPRSECERKLCDQVRTAVTGSVDWPCEVFTLFRDDNLGCAPAVSAAIDWFFGCEEEGIILEDDCLPDHTFFAYCSELLTRYRSDTRIGQISGFNLLPSASPQSVDYFASHFGWCWGWATWRRAWQSFDMKMQSWPRLIALGLHRQHPFYRERIYLFDQVASGVTHDSCWDYQWHYALASMGQLSLVPAVNLVQNIGFTDDATHTRRADGRRSRIASSIASDRLIRHPEFLLPFPAYEARLMKAAHWHDPRVWFKRKLRSVWKRVSGRV
jgi:hypothetical protein